MSRWQYVLVVACGSASCGRLNDLSLLEPDEAGSGGSAAGGSDSGGELTAGAAGEQQTGGRDAGTGGNPSTGGVGFGGAVDGSGGASGGGSGGTDSSGGSGGGPSIPTITCETTTHMTIGNQYAGYVVQTMSFDPALDGATYRMALLPEQEGVVHLFAGQAHLGSFDYDPSASLAESTLQTIDFDGYFSLGIRSASSSDLSALGESFFDGCHLFYVPEAAEVTPGTTYDGIVVNEVTLFDATPSGTYTFASNSGTAGVVDLLRDGVVVSTLEYPWGFTITDVENYTFVFEGYMSVTVGRDAGSSNLFAMPQGLFDGRQHVTVE